MTAIEKLRAAFASQASRNVSLHDEYIMVGQDDGSVGEVVRYVEPADYGQDDNDPEPLTVFDMLEALREIEELAKREPLPFKQVITDPNEAYMAILAEWEDDKRKLSYYKEQEGEKRRILFAGAFPNPKEGTNRHKLPDGRQVVGKYTIGRKIDEAALPVTLQAMREAGVANTDVLVSYKPSLAKREWNTLSEDNKLLFSAAVIATPGMPGLEIEQAKGGR